MTNRRFVAYCLEFKITVIDGEVLIRSSSEFGVGFHTVKLLAELSFSLGMTCTSLEV